jgi:hypothetical protein
MKGTKKERREKRHQRNIQKEKTHKEEAWKAGKLIEENHNGESYSPQYAFELGERLASRIRDIRKACEGLSSSEALELCLLKFRLYRQKIRDYILHFPQDIEKTEDYEYLKDLLETYWDTPSKLLENI